MLINCITITLHHYGVHYLESSAQVIISQSGSSEVSNYDNIVNIFPLNMDYTYLIQNWKKEMADGLHPQQPATLTSAAQIGIGATSVVDRRPHMNYKRPRVIIISFITFQV